MRLKPGTELLGLRPEMVVAILAVYAAYQEHCKSNGDYEAAVPLITSCTDGKHSKGSRHYVGCAVDFRTRYLSEEQKDAIFSDLIRWLGDQFDVILEPTHLHIEFDPEYHHET